MLRFTTRTTGRFYLVAQIQRYEWDVLDLNKIVYFRCYADFARVGGRQQVSLADECVRYPTVIHELMHVIGFIHEHQREDRDSYVYILWDNIIAGKALSYNRPHTFHLYL